MLPVNIHKSTQDSLFQEPLQGDDGPVTDPLRIHRHKSTGEGSPSAVGSRGIVTGIHQNLGEGCGGWSGLTTSILTLGGLGLIALADPAPALAQPQGGICDRTPGVLLKIVSRINGVTRCQDVTDAHLSGITGRLDFDLEIHRLQEGDFDGLSNLEEIHFTNNGLTSLPENIFAGLSNLQILSFNERMGSLPEGIFDGLSKLEHLWLQNNILNSLDADIFDGLSNLETLNLSGNSLNSLDADIFAGLSSLNWINLEANALNSLPEDIFDGLPNLLHIDLGRNSLSNLAEGVFSWPSTLTFLSLPGNDLPSLGAGAFAGLTNLRTLELNDNPRMSSLPDDIFAGLSNLRYLDLAGNGLVCLPRSLPWSRVASAFRSDSNLLTIDVELPDCFGVSLSVTPMEMEEGSDGESITVTATLTTGARPTSVDTEVAISVVGETATEGTDFVAVDPFIITIPDGSESATGTFTLTTVEDAGDEGDETVQVSGTSTVFSYSAEVSDATVTIKDFGVVLEPTSLSTGEGETTTYTVRLNILPAGAVTITTTSDDSGAVSVSPARLTFTTANWATAQTVSVTAVQDGDGNDERVAINHGVSGYGHVTAAAAVTVSVTEDDVPGVDATPTTLMMTEGSSGTYTLVLDTNPNSNVTITTTSSDSGAVSISPTSLAFTTSNWDTAQMVTVAAVDDQVNNEDRTVTISHSLSGNNILTSATPVMVTIANDDEFPAISVCDRSSYARRYILNKISGVTACEDVTTSHLNGITGTFDFEFAALGDDPLKERDFDDLSNLQSILISFNLLRSLPEGIFTGLSNLQTLWIIGQTAMRSLPEGIFTGLSNLQSLALFDNDLSSLPDDIFAGLSSLENLLLSGNSGLKCLPRSVPWDRVDSSDLYLDVSLPDCFRVSLRVTPMEVNEGNEGESMTVSATLSNGPRGRREDTEVRISVAEETAAEGTDFVAVEPFTITIPNGSESATGTFVLTAAVDAVEEPGGETVRLSGTSNAGAYAAQVDSTTVTIEDTPGVRVRPTDLEAAEDGMSTYTLVLATDPGGPVTVTPVNGDSGAVSLSPASFTFTPSNWDTAQTVSVAGVEDADGNDETVTVNHRVSGYGSVTVGAVARISVTDDEEPGVRVEPASPLANEGGTTSYTLALATLPGGPVTVTPVSGDSGAVSLSPIRLTFTPSNWTTAQTVTVTGVEDTDGNDETVTVNHSVSGYGSVTTGAAVTVAVTDDEEPGVRVSPVSMSPIGEGGTTSYSLVLDTDPVRPVTITPVSGDGGAVSLSPASLVFTPANWDTAQTVRVTGAEDDDARDEMVSISHRVNGYGRVTSAAAVTVAVTDDDEPGVTMDVVSVGPIEEGRVETVYSLVLDTQPDGPVTITPVSGDSGALTVSPASLVFTPFIWSSPWNNPWTVRVTAVEDDDTRDETVTISHSVSGYGSVTSAGDVTVTVTDDDEPGVSVSPARVSPIEGREAVPYSLVLDTLPAGPVTIAPVSGDSGAVSVSPASLTFTTSNWETGQTVMVTAVNDEDMTSETVTVSHSVSGYGNVSVGAVVTVSVTDSGRPGVGVQRIDLEEIEEGETRSYYVVTLITDPGGPVTIMASSGDSDAVSLSPARLTFTPANWETARTITVTGVEDADGNDEMVTISHRVSGYGSVTSAGDVTVNLKDDDEPEVRVMSTSVSTDEGDAATYTLTLATLPNGPVTIMASSGDSDAVSLSPASFTFTPSNWDTAQTVSVTGVEDADTRDEAVTVSHSVSGYEVSGDDPVTTAADVTVTVTDDDEPGVSVEDVTLSLGGESGSGSYSLTLASQPNGPVTITPTSGDSDAVSVSPVRLIFTPSNWDTAQMVSVTGIEDADGNDETVTISHSVSGYDPVTTAAGVTVTVTDDDEPGVSVMSTSVSIIEGRMATYTLQLATQPNGPVTITPTSGDSDAVSVSPASLTFTTANWDTAQMVSVTGVEDDDTRDETVTIRHSVSGYGSVTANSVTVTVDEPGVSVMSTSVSPIEGRAAVSYTLVLDTQPDGPVTIMASSGDSDAVNVAPASLTFTPSNWHTAQVVRVTAMEDGNTDNETVTIRHDVSGYGSVTTAADVTVSVTDDDAPGVHVQPIILEPQEGETLTYVVMLITQPDSPVTITTASGDSDAVSVSPTSLTFTPSNWDTAQMVSVTGVEDADTTSETVTISHNVSGYGAVTTATAVTVSVMDTDTAAVSVSPTSVSTSEGEAATYTLQLRTQPDGNVTITPTSGDSDAVSVSPASLTFTPSNWDTPRTVSVMGVEDTDTDNESVTIRHNVSGYTTVTTAAALTVSVADAGEDTGEDTRQSQARTEAENVLKQVVVPELVQQLSAETTEVITSRLNSIASGLPTAPLNLSLDQVVADTVAFLYGEREHLKEGSLEWRQALAGRDFAFPLSGLDLAQGEGAGGQDHLFSSLAIWGGGDYSSYGNTIKGTDVEGSGFSGTIGMDLQPTPRLVSGVALTTSRWGLDYTTTATDGSEEQGTYEMGITVLNPYVNWLATEQLSLWATFGYGRGAVEHHPDGEDDPSPQTDTGSLTSWAGGLRFAVVPGKDPLTGEGSPLGLAFKVDAATSSFLGSDAQLARLAAELSHSFVMEKGLLTAALELAWSIRSVSDNDDAAGGGGAELASRLNWLSSDGSVSTTVDTRVLLGGGDRREWGIGGHLRLTPSRQGGKGLSLTLQPSLGVTGTRLAELWSLSGDGDLAINSDGPAARLDARLAYGFPLDNALLTPYTEAMWDEAASTYGAGLRYRLNTSLELDLKGVHRSNTNGNTEHRFSLDMHSDL